MTLTADSEGLATNEEDALAQDMKSSKRCRIHVRDEIGQTGWATNE